MTKEDAVRPWRAEIGPPLYATLATTIFAFVGMAFVSPGPCAGLKDTGMMTRSAALGLGIAVLASGVIALASIGRLRRGHVLLRAVVSLPFVLWNLLLCLQVGLMAVIAAIAGM